MSLHQLEKVLNVGRALIQADPASDLLEELEHLCADHARQEATLARLHGELGLVCQTIAEKEEAVALLPIQVADSFRRGKKSQALRQALELDSLRRELGEAQQEKARLEHTCWCLEFRVRQLARLMQKLRDEVAAC